MPRNRAFSVSLTVVTSFSERTTGFEIDIKKNPHKGEFLNTKISLRCMEEEQSDEHA